MCLSQKMISCVGLKIIGDWNKNIYRIVGSLLALLLSACSKTTINMNCIPPLYYELDKGSKISVFGDTENKSIDKALRKYGLNKTQESINL